jgi:hypothetical protein
MLTLLVVLVFVCIGVSFFWWWVVTAKRFDSVLLKIYTINRKQWHALGEPIGFFWYPQGPRRFFKATNARNRLFFSFLFHRSSLKPIDPLEGEEAGEGERKTSGLDT